LDEARLRRVLRGKGELRFPCGFSVENKSHLPSFAANAAFQYAFFDLIIMLTSVSHKPRNKGEKAEEKNGGNDKRKLFHNCHNALTSFL
jgi:hypothetical protein